MDKSDGNIYDYGLVIDGYEKGQNLLKFLILFLIVINTNLEVFLREKTENL